MRYFGMYFRYLPSSKYMKSVFFKVFLLPWKLNIKLKKTFMILIQAIDVWSWNIEKVGLGELF